MNNIVTEKYILYQIGLEKLFGYIPIHSHILSAIHCHQPPMSRSLMSFWFSLVVANGYECVFMVIIIVDWRNVLCLHGWVGSNFQHLLHLHESSNSKIKTIAILYLAKVFDYVQVIKNVLGWWIRSFSFNEMVVFYVNSIFP